LQTIIDTLPKPSALEGSVEHQVRSAASTVQVNRYQWREPREAVFKSDAPIIDIVLARHHAELDGEYLEAPRQGPRPVGEILFMPPNYTLHSRWDRGERRSMCCVLDSASFADFFEIDWRDKKLAASLNVCNGFIRSTMLRLVSEAVAPSFASELLVESLSTALAVELRRHFDMLDPESAIQEGGLSTRQLRRIRESLEDEDPRAPVTVAELARREQMSVRHFSRLFRLSTQKTVSDYAAEIRIERAKLLLSDDRILIKEIAYRCGFQSSSGFSAAFRNSTSLTPQQYRAARMD
jgi:AraC family transcriptional regulator